MSKRDLLLEIGTEELPARFISAAVQQLQEKVEQWLQNERITYDSIQTFETPRRLAVRVTGVSEQQSDRNEEAKGPAKKIALDEAGNWTKAALGFARSNGVEPDQLFFKEVNGVEYVFARKNEQGKATESLLPALRDVLTGLTFPKNMRWGSWDLRYARPIRWLVALYGDQVVEMEIAGVRSGRTTRGHRFLGTDVEISLPVEYESLLEGQYVIADPEKRRASILEQLRRLEAEKGWVIPVEEGLLEEVVHLVEYPTVLFGTFDESFLGIPRDVLVTSMREHQRYFPVQNQSGDLLPYFVTVRNGNDRSLENVAKGNEKVLRARLSDARFFYEEDQKLTIDQCLNKLESIVFHEELGTIGDKVRRIRKLSESIAKALSMGGEETRHVQRIAEIAKFDLVTQMVYEFPELQGIMGEDYARKLGEPDTVARGIFEHYLPRFAGDQLPASAEGAVVSISDKLDTIAGCFAIGIIPTGSQDPYALRRQAAGIVNILHDKGWRLSLPHLFDMALEAYREQGVNKRPADEVKQELSDFFALRLKNLMQDEGIRYDVIDAALGAELNDVPRAVQTAKALMVAVAQEEFKGTVEQFTRTLNLAAKAEVDAIDASLFLLDVERSLYQAYLSVKEEAEAKYAENDMQGVLQALSALRSPIQAFFDGVMVMAEDLSVRRNRLALLLSISRELAQFANFHKLVFA